MGQDLSNWYTASQAAKQLSNNSGKYVDPAYVRKLAAKGLIETLPLGPRTTLYKRQSIDGYTVEARGLKAGRAMHNKAKRGKEVRL